MDLSQHPANTVLDKGATATEVRGAVGPVKVAVTLDVCRSGQLWFEVFHNGLRGCGKEGRNETRLTNFNIYALDVAGRFGHVDSISIVWVGDDS
jgi:hypothetical protein